MRRRLQIAIECLREAEQLYESQENGSTTQPGGKNTVQKIFKHSLMINKTD